MVAPAAIVWVAPLLIAIAAAALVGAPIEQLRANEPPSDPGVTTLTAWLPVPPVSVGLAPNATVGAVATAGAALITLSGVTAAGVRSDAPVPSHVLVVMLISGAVGPTVNVPAGALAGTVSVNAAAKMPLAAAIGVTPSPTTAPALDVLGASALLVPLRKVVFDCNGSG